MSATFENDVMPLISAVAFELMDEAYAQGGFDSTAIGFLAAFALSKFGG